jgi:hypothetical protein
MAIGDILFKETTPAGYAGDVRQQVAAGAIGSIVAGIPVSKALGQPFVVPLATNQPVVGTTYMAGVSATLSTDTVSVAGYVRVARMQPGVIYLAKPKVAATFATQALYNALVGARVLFDLTAGVYTILAADSANNGLVIEDLEISRYPGMVAFSFRQALSYQA